MQLVHSALKSKYSANCREKKIDFSLFSLLTLFVLHNFTIFRALCLHNSDQKVKFLQNNAAAQLWQLFLRNTMYILKFVFYKNW